MNDPQRPTIEPTQPVASAQGFDELRRTWQTLGTDDPLWAILTDSDRRRGRWDLEEFLQRGETDVARYDVLLGDAGHTGRFGSVLDFGCGVGRLSLAWGRRADSVTGVDISRSMIERGRIVVASAPNVRLLVNDAVDLGQFPDESFDLVFSHICLQHMPWPLAAGYIAEFGRVAVRGGFVAFQLPSRGPARTSARRRIVDSLPEAVRSRYRRWRHGTSVVFDMYYTDPVAVIEVARSAGLDLCHQEPDGSAGVGTEGFIYIFRRHG
jgi:SAM-dependent methyltransferase